VPFLTRRPQVILLFVALTLFSAASAFGQCSLAAPSTTANAGTQDFNTAGDWSSGAPNSTTNACIINGSTVTLATGQSGNVLNLQINAGNTLNLSNNTDLFTSGAQIINGGAINAQAAANDVIIGLEATTTLSGTGTLTLSESGGGTAIIQQQVGNVTLNNQSNIVGAGLIGNGALTVNNTGGTINANASTQTLEIDASGGVTNGAGGLLTATNGGTLQIDNITVSNAGGNITANGGAVVLNGTTINGGTLTAENGGTLSTIANGSATLNGVTINGTYSSGNNTDLFLGATTNTGIIALTSGANDTLLGLTASTTLGNTVMMTQTGNGNVIIQQQSGGLTMTNAGTIEGAGIIGNGALTVINNGTINANNNNGIANATAGQTTLFLDGSGGVTNNSLIEATNGGTLQINAITVANGSGNITANGGAVVLDGTTINGGTLTAENGGTLSTIANGSATLNGVTINGTYSSGNNTDLFLGATTNTGIIALTSAANDTILGLTASTTLGNTVMMTQTGNGNVIIQQQSGGLTMTNAGTIEGAGIIGNGALTVINNGTINANNNNGIANATAGQTTLFLDGSGGVTNNSLIEATNGGTLQINAITVANGSGNITANGGAVVLDGATINGGALNAINGGTLSTIANGSATLNGVTINGTYSSGNNTDLFLSGTITNNGTIALTSAANDTILGITANTTLSGGTVTMTETAGGNVIIQQQAGNLTLTNNGAINGAGIIGNGALTFVNNGTVNANSSGQTLTLNGSGGVTNNNLLEATNSGTLTINGITVNNSGGTINGNGGTVQIGGNATIQGGLLLGTQQTVSGSTATFDGTTNGPLTIGAGATYTDGNNSNLFVQGSIVNNGSLNIAAGANDSIMGLLANTALSGTGGLTLSTTGGGTAIIEQLAGGLTLTNQSTIQGTGTIGNGALTTVNGASGLLLARDGDSLTINGSGGLTNSGTMQVNAGGTMTVTSNLTNFSGGTLTGGTYIVNGASGNNGTMSLNLGTNTGNEITTNAAIITLNGPTANTLLVDNNGHNALGALATNTGNLTIEGGYAFNTSAATFNNNNGGLVNIGAGAGSGASFSVNGGSGIYDQTSGLSTALNNGTLTASQVNINAGLLQGFGTVTSPTTTIGSGGTLSPGALATTSAGNIDFSGASNLTLNAGSAMNEIITGSQAGQFSTTTVGGTLTINGSAGLDIINSTGVSNGAVLIGVGTQLTIMTSNSLTGGFTNADITSGGTFDNGLEAWTVAKVGNDEVLNATANGLVTATFTGAVSNSWTGEGGSAGSLTSNWTCSVPIVSFSGNDCVPNNGNPIAGTNYEAVVNSGNATLSSSDTPSSITITGAQVTGGSLTIGNGGTLTVGVSQYQQTGGVTEVDGTGVLDVTASSMTLSGGTLQGTGTVNGLVSVSGTGTVLAGTPGTPGTLALGNNLLFDGGTLDETLNGSAAGQFGAISVGGVLNLASGGGATTLDILDSTGVLNGTTVIAPGTILTIATSSNPVQNTFATVDGMSFDNGQMYWQVLYNQGGDNIELQAESVTPAGVTATWGPVSNSANTSGNWTDMTEWGCTPGPVNCVPNNGGGTTYAAILDSTGNTLTLSTAETVNSVDIQAGTLGLSGGSVTALDSFTVEANGFVSGNGTIVSPSFTNNATVNPGGVLATGGTLDLSGSTITNLSGTILNGGVWTAGGNGVAGTLKLPGDIVTNNSGLLFLDQPGSEITDSANADALAGLTSNNNGAHLAVFDGASESITPGGGTFTNNGSFLNSSFGGSSLTINGNLINSDGSDITINGNFGGAGITVTGNLTNQDTSTIEVNNGGVLGIGGNLNLQGGTITVSDPAVLATSQLNVTGNVTVGGAVTTDPTLQIQNGASMTIGGNLINNATGNVFTGNAPSDTGNNTLTVGGTLTNNGTVELFAAGDSITIGNTTNPGTAQLSNSGTLTVNSATAAFNINQQGAFSNNTNSGIINLTGSLNFTNDAGQGANILGGGTINLSGGSITANATNFLTTNNAITGDGSITGPQFITTGSITPTGTITISPNANGFTDNGTVTVNGSGNVLELVGTGGAGSTTIGFQTNGSMTVENGGSFTSQSFVTVGSGAGGNGTLNVLTGGTVSAGTLTVAFNGSTGTVLINGAGSQYTDSGDLNINGVNGSVTVSGGGTLSLATGTVTNEGGNLTVGGAGGSSLLSAATFNQSSGTTTVADGGTISVSGVFTESGGSVDIQAGGVIDPTSYLVNGGTTEVDGSLTATTVTVANAGELTGNGGTITGNLTNNGTLSPGTGAAPGTLTVNGTVTLGATSDFIEQIAGLNDFGVLLDNTGNIALGGTLDVELLNGYTPTVGSTYTFIDPPSYTGAFTNDIFPTLGNGDEFIVQYNADNTELCVVTTNNQTCGASAPPPPVPEPKSVILLGTVVAAALWYRRRRNVAQA
jgi:fibronectin-binding autotransporter adhesin